MVKTNIDDQNVDSAFRMYGGGFDGIGERFFTQLFAVHPMNPENLPTSIKCAIWEKGNSRRANRVAHTRKSDELGWEVCGNTAVTTAKQIRKICPPINQRGPNFG